MQRRYFYTALLTWALAGSLWAPLGAQTAVQVQAENEEPVILKEELSLPAETTVEVESTPSASAPTQEELPLYDLRGDDGVLMNFRPTGISFLSRDRVVICDGNSPQLHIFDVEGRRFRRLAEPRTMSQPRYTGLCNLEDNKFFVVGSHHHVQNNVRFLWARGVLHYYELRNERFTDNSAETNYDPELAWRRTGFFGENAKERLRVEGVTCDQVSDSLYFALSQPVNPDESVLIYRISLQDVINRKKRLRFETLPTSLIPGLDPTINEPFVLTDIFHVPDRGLLLLVSSKTPDERRAGTSQIWFQPDGSSQARLVADNIAPGNFASGIAAYQVGATYNLGLIFDNDPELTTTPSRFLLLEDISL